MAAPFGTPDATQIDARIPKLKDACRIANEVRIAVKTKLDIGVGNFTDTPTWVKEKVDRMRKFTGPQIILPGAFVRYVTDARKVAENAIRARCGNCGEHAAVAFVMLIDRGVEPIDLMECTSTDHSFVVIGRRENSDPGRYDSVKWGPDAVICDPWANEAYPCPQMSAKMAGLVTIFTFRSRCRYRTIEGRGPL